MGAVAVAMKRKGFTVTGSDTNVYPPMSDFLRNEGIEITEGYRAENLPPGADVSSLTRFLNQAHDRFVVTGQADLALRRLVAESWRRSVEAGLDPADTVEALLPELRSAEWDAALDATIERTLSTGTTALLVHADAEAMALVQRCEEHHLSVPDDLSVVAYDDEVAVLFSPALTAVRPPRLSIGRAAVDLLVARFADPGRPAHRVVISPSLRVRESTTPPRDAR